MGYSLFKDVQHSIISNHSTLITDAVDKETGQLGFAWKDDRHCEDSSSFLFMPYDLWVDDTFLEEEESQMAFVEKKLSTEIRRLNDELREASRKISL